MVTGVTSRPLRLDAPGLDTTRRPQRFRASVTRQPCRGILPRPARSHVEEQRAESERSLYERAHHGLTVKADIAPSRPTQILFLSLTLKQPASYLPRSARIHPAFGKLRSRAAAPL